VLGRLVGQLTAVLGRLFGFFTLKLGQPGRCYFFLGLFMFGLE